MRSRPKHDCTSIRMARGHRSRRVLGPRCVTACAAGLFAQLSLAQFIVEDTRQATCYDDWGTIACPTPTGAFAGQDSQHVGPAPTYADNGDGTITDRATGLMWQKAVIANISWSEATAGAAASTLGGHTDWRLPSIKELYSLIRFDGRFGTQVSDSVPFIDTDFFSFSYTSPPRFFDVQEWSSTEYVGTTMNGDATVFGVNFADGRIKGYPKYEPGSGGTVPHRMYARYVRGNPEYGINGFVVPGDGTVVDLATGLMWAQTDSGAGLDWEAALAWVRARNVANYLGHDDWRLPNAKELQSIVDYTRAPDATHPARVGPAIAPVFQITQLPGGEYPYFWSGTTLVEGPATGEAATGVYVAFGRALGWMQLPSGGWALLNVHGAGSQRGDPKSGDPNDYPHGHGPQGDVVRIENHVRLVRDAWKRGDMNCDGVVDFRDIDPFITALNGPVGYSAQLPDCHQMNADCNEDGRVTFADIDAFVARLGS